MRVDARADRACRYGGRRRGALSCCATPRARGRLKPADPAQPEQGSGYIVLAMGKMGAFELNYSSDIDLIVFYDPRRAGARAKDVEPAPFFVRLTRGLVKLLQERTADGYVFRVDLRLRPDPASTQIAVSTDGGARTTTRASARTGSAPRMIKARACAGDIAAGEAFLRELAPFIWRKYLDYAAVADIHAMKRQIHAYRGHDEIAVEGHNIKLGRGGIREIEFFVQTQQLIAGGRHPELRGRETLATLTALAEGGWIGAEAARRSRRGLSVPARGRAPPADGGRRADPHAAGRARGARALRALCSASRTATPSREALLEHLRKVQRHYARLFEDAPAAEAAQRALVVSRPRPTTARRSTGSRAMGFRQPLEVSATRARAGWPAAIRSLRASSRARISPSWCRCCIDHLARAENPDAALAALRPVPRRPARRRAAVLAAAAESGSRRADRADARHRAAARRHPGAAIRR